MAHITARLGEGVRVELRTDRHIWYADEPVTAGGTDTGPSPYEMLLGSLAACTVVTLRLYTQHKGIKIDWVTAEYQYGRITSGDDEGGTSQKENRERITAHVTIGGNFDDGQRKRLEQIVGRCPVHRTLSAGVEILDHVTFVEHVS